MFLYSEFGFQITFSTLDVLYHDFSEKWKAGFISSSSLENELHKGASEKNKSVIGCSVLNLATVIVGWYASREKTFQNGLNPHISSVIKQHLAKRKSTLERLCKVEN